MTTVDLPAPALDAAEGGGWALSPSRALDFKNCALLYRLRVIDKLPEPTSVDAARGTVIHAVLEQLFDAPAASRTVGTALEAVEPQWRELITTDPELAELVDSDPGGFAALLDSTRDLLRSYFTLEDPTRLEPAERELLVETTLPSGVRLKGFIDRLDRSPAGDLRVVDYKSGKSPSELFEGKALFQLRFYALMLWRETGVLPRVLRLYYLSDREILDYSPDEADLRSLERQLDAIATAITTARETGDWRHKPGRLCDWCSHHAVCPAFGGTPPPLPEPEPAPDSAAEASPPAA
jgi:putative RecB family exonuclease